MYFISFSSKDMTLAKNLVKKLKKYGHRVWFAPAEIKSSENYAEEIIRAMKECNSTILIFSKNSNDSKHVQREVSLALEYKKNIYPVRIENTLPTDSMEYFLNTLQWHDIYDNYPYDTDIFIKDLPKHDDYNSSDEPDLLEKKEPDLLDENETTLLKKKETIYEFLYFLSVLLLESMHQFKNPKKVIDIALQDAEGCEAMLTIISGFELGVVQEENRSYLMDSFFKDFTYLENKIPDFMNDPLFKPFEFDFWKSHIQPTKPFTYNELLKYKESYYKETNPTLLNSYVTMINFYIINDDVLSALVMQKKLFSGYAQLCKEDASYEDEYFKLLRSFIDFNGKVIKNNFQELIDKAHDAIHREFSDKIDGI